MNFPVYMNAWVKSEVTQGRIMIVVGILLLFAFYAIFRSDNILLKGGLIPLAIAIAVLIGYGGYILTSRPAHAEQSISLYQANTVEAVAKEKEKHISDNKAGNFLKKYVYPSLMLVSVIALILVSSVYFKGMAIGFIMLFATTYIVDYGFVSRSEAFIAYLDNN